MRRTVATLLVVASPLLLAAPVGAGDVGLTSGYSTPAEGPAAPVVRPPAVPDVVSVTVPAVPAAAAVRPPAAPAPVRQAVRPTGTKARAAIAGLSDSAYTARLQAELCAARQIFCGLTTNGRYPTR